MNPVALYSVTTISEVNLIIQNVRNELRKFFRTQKLSAYGKLGYLQEAAVHKSG